MKLYASVNVCKDEEENVETTKYYILEDKLYGIKVIKEVSDPKLNEEYTVKNISESEDEIKKVIDNILNNESDISQMEYYINDLLFNPEE